MYYYCYLCFIGWGNLAQKGYPTCVRSHRYIYQDTGMTAVGAFGLHVVSWFCWRGIQSRCSLSLWWHKWSQEQGAGEQEPQILELWAHHGQTEAIKIVICSDTNHACWQESRGLGTLGFLSFMILLPIEFWGEPNAFKPDMISWIGPNSLWPKHCECSVRSGVGGPCKTNASERASIWLVPNAEQRASGWMQRSAGLSTQPVARLMVGCFPQMTLCFLCYVHFSDSSCRPILLYY